jgi:hybrid cluster-associated redox disulfide protein
MPCIHGQLHRRACEGDEPSLRRRNDGPPPTADNGGMTTETPIELTSNLEDALRGHPALVGLFLARRMACPGCVMAPFEDLADAARHHGMEGEELLAAARRDIEAETRRSLERIRKEVADLTVLTTEKVARKSLDSADHKKLVDDALAEVDFASLSPEGADR